MLIATSEAPAADQEYRAAPRQLVRHREPLVRRGPHTALRLRRKRMLDPARVYFNRAWFAAGTVGAVAGMLGLRRFGWPVLAGAGALGALTWGHASYREPGRPTLQRVELHLKRLPPDLDGLRIGQLSDLHLGFRFGEQNALWGVEQMRREGPDVIALTGDLISFRHAIPDLASVLRGLRAPLGVYAVSGNHDHWDGVEDVRAALAVCDIPMLVNEHRRLVWNGADLWLLGADDVWDCGACQPAHSRCCLRTRRIT
jgi:hypothetical protein